MKLISLLILMAWCKDGETFLEKIGNFVPKPPNFGDLVSKIPNPIDMVFQNKCIEDLGCFYTGPPFYHPINRPISLTPTDNLKVHLLLFTPTNRQDGEDLDTTAKSISDSSFDPKFPLKVLIHGFRVQLEESSIPFQTKDALLSAGDYNVIVVDWTENNGPPYAQAVANARAVAAKLAKLLNVIMETTGLKAENIHLIGHSLGGQISGWTGERIPNLGRITGLDPAGPYFQNAGKGVCLDATDALFVDVIHTDGGDNFIDGLGMGEPIGHMDFYPNGGNRQPGCAYTSDSESVIGSFLNSTSKVFSTVCSHSRANNYFLESIDNSKCRFLATWCNSYRDFEKGDCLPQNSTVAEMGFHAKRIQGVPMKSKFYLRTNDKEPFCIENSVYLRNEI